MYNYINCIYVAFNVIPVGPSWLLPSGEAGFLFHFWTYLRRVTTRNHGNWVVTLVCKSPVGYTIYKWAKTNLELLTTYTIRGILQVELSLDGQV